MGVPLSALNGRLLGSVQLLDVAHESPTELDEALIVHLAQMAAAALERTTLYAEPPDG